VGRGAAPKSGAARGGGDGTHPQGVLPVQDDHPPVDGVQQLLQDQLDVLLHIHLQGERCHSRA